MKTKLCLTALALLMAITPAIAADQAPAQPNLQLPRNQGPGKSYDYVTKAPTKLSPTAGIYFGIGTIGGGGNVNATVPGVASASLTSNQIGAFGIVGWAWPTPGYADGMIAVEGWFGVNNVNGATPGFSLTGPASFMQRVMVGVPLADVMAVFPSLSIPTIPPFPPPPNGQTIVGPTKLYISGNLWEDDITLNVAGLGSNKDWQFAPGIGVGGTQQWSGGSVIDATVMLKFPQKAVCVGPGIGTLCGKEGTQILGGLALKFL